MAIAEDEELYAYFYDVILLPYVAYRTTRNDRQWGTRKDWKSAIEVARDAYHFSEHLPDQYKQDRQALVARCPDFALLGDVVNASKHKHLTRGRPQIDSVDSIQEQIVITRFQDEHGEYKAASKSIEITLKDGTTRELFDVLTNVVNMWVDFLQTEGVSGKAVPFPHEDRNRIIRRDEAGEIELVATRGVAAKLAFKFQNYNYAKGYPEPVDLTGYQFSFRAYDPKSMKVEVTMRAASPEGKEYSGSVELDAEESAEYHLLKENAEQDEFINKIMMRRGELILHSDQTDGPGTESLIAKFGQAPDTDENKTGET